MHSASPAASSGGRGRRKRHARIPGKGASQHLPGPRGALPQEEPALSGNRSRCRDEQEVIVGGHPLQKQVPIVSGNEDLGGAPESLFMGHPPAFLEKLDHLRAESGKVKTAGGAPLLDSQAVRPGQGPASDRRVFPVHPLNDVSSRHIRTPSPSSQELPSGWTPPCPPVPFLFSPRVPRATPAHGGPGDCPAGSRRWSALPPPASPGPSNRSPS